MRSVIIFLFKLVITSDYYIAYKKFCQYQLDDAKNSFAKSSKKVNLMGSTRG